MSAFWIGWNVTRRKTELCYKQLKLLPFIVVAVQDKALTGWHSSHSTHG